MPHLRLVPPLAETQAAVPAQRTPDESPTVAVPAQRTPYEDPKVALMFFQAASGVCLCRSCAKDRHPAYGAR